jgi:uncharacterized protein (DUF362 family)
VGTLEKHSHTVGVWRQATGSYSSVPPYHPPALYPELAFCEGVTLDRSNEVYASVRNLFSLLDYDSAHRGSAGWNPLAWLIKPGDTVFVKPNLIAERHANSEEWIDLITHGAVMRALIDYVFLALQGKGRIQVADAPQTDSNITALKKKIGIDAIQEFYRRKVGFEIEFLDLREEYWESKDGIITKKHKLGGDPLGTVRFDLGSASYFAEIDGLRRRYYGAFYDVEETNRHHGSGVHEYLMARSPLAADVFISVPKMKTHKKVGVTLNLKGLVGITGDKNYLPHYALGSPDENGDQFPARKAATVIENAVVGKAKRFLARGIPLAVYVSRKTKPLLYRVFGGPDEIVRAGNWWGNDTCWRMALDLNQLLLYANSDGTFRSAPKRYFSVVDGIIGMEGNGPVAGTPRPAGLLLAGENPSAVDVVTATLMGFDYRKLPLLHRSFDADRFPIAQGDPTDTQVLSNWAPFNTRLDKISFEDTLAFKPHFGWSGRVELDPTMQPAVVSS